MAGKKSADKLAATEMKTFSIADIKAAYALDEDKVTNGVELPLKALPGVKVRVARGGNPDYLRRMTELYDENREVLDKEDEAASELDHALHIIAVSETILIGFVNITEPYSPEAAQALLEDRDIFNEVMAAANNRENYKAKAIADDKKN